MIWNPLVLRVSQDFIYPIYTLKFYKKLTLYSFKYTLKIIRIPPYLGIV